MIGALWTGISGLSSQQQALDNESNNIANVNTVGFKSSRISFADQMYQDSIGKGSKILDAEKLYTQGNLKLTGVSYDMALSGDGFFTVADTRASGTSENYYTRAGNFRMGDNGTLQDAAGNEVQGWMMTSIDPDSDVTSTNPNVSIFTNDYTKLLSSKVIEHSTYVETITAKATDYSSTAMSDAESVFSGAGLKTKSAKISDVEAAITDYSNWLQKLRETPDGASSTSVTQISEINFKTESEGLIKKEGDQIYVYINGNKISQNYISTTTSETLTNVDLNGSGTVDEDDQNIQASRIATYKGLADKISEIPGLVSYMVSESGGVNDVLEQDDIFALSTTNADMGKGIIQIKSLIPGEEFTISEVGEVSGNNTFQGGFQTSVAAQAGSGTGALESSRDALAKLITGKQQDVYKTTDLNIAGAPSTTGSLAAELVEATGELTIATTNYNSAVLAESTAQTAVTTATTALVAPTTDYNTAVSNEATATTDLATATAALATATVPYDAATADVATATANLATATTALAAETTSPYDAQLVALTTATAASNTTDISNALSALITLYGTNSGTTTAYDAELINLDTATTASDQTAIDAAAAALLTLSNSYTTAYADEAAAQSALSTANTALVTPTNDYNTAVTAEATAQTALTAATAALATATTAFDTATEDLATANTSLTDATTALATAQAALTVATAEEADAQDAVTDYPAIADTNDYTFGITIFDKESGTNIPVPNDGSTPPVAQQIQLLDVESVDDFVTQFNEAALLSTPVLTDYVEAVNINGNLVIRTLDKNYDVDFSTDLKRNGTPLDKNNDLSGRSGAGAEFIEIVNNVNQVSTQGSLQLRLDTLGISDSAFGEFSVDNTGLITMTQDGADFAIGQVAIALFNNNIGLEAQGDNLLSKTTDSGDPIYNLNNDKAANIEGQTLELSTADLSESLVNLMVFQRAFEANAKSITTADEILTTLIGLKR